MWFSLAKLQMKRVSSELFEATMRLPLAKTQMKRVSSKFFTAKMRVCWRFVVFLGEKFRRNMFRLNLSQQKHTFVGDLRLSLGKTQMKCVSLEFPLATHERLLATCGFPLWFSVLYLIACVFPAKVYVPQKESVRGVCPTENLEKTSVEKQKLTEFTQTIFKNCLDFLSLSDCPSYFVCVSGRKTARWKRFSREERDRTCFV